MTQNKPLLAVVDYQNDYVNQKGKIAKRLKNDLIEKRKIFPTINNLLVAWHERENPVLFILNDYNTKYYHGAYRKYRLASVYGNTALRGTWGHKLYKIKPNKKDKIIIKKFPNGFIKTSLKKYLDNLHPSEIFFTGINTDVCVFHTAFQAAILGYKVSVIEDATSATDLKNKKVFLEHLKKVVGANITKSKLLLKEKI
jgi:nicotinamidase-related amidase